MKYIEKNIECDSKKLYEDSHSVYNMATEYQKLIDNFYYKLDFTSNSNRAWFGNNADTYTNIVLLDKKTYTNVGEEIKKLAIQMKEFAEKMDTTVRLNEESCENEKEDENDLWRWFR